MHACIHKIEKRLNMTVPLKKWNKEKDGNGVHFYLQVNHVRPRAGRWRATGTHPWTGHAMVLWYPVSLLTRESSGLRHKRKPQKNKIYKYWTDKIFWVWFRVVILLELRLNAVKLHLKIPGCIFNWKSFMLRTKFCILKEYDFNFYLKHSK